MPATRPYPDITHFPFRHAGRIVHAMVSLLLLVPGIAFAGSPAKKNAKPAVKEAPKPTEVLIFKNGDQITGKLLNSTGTKIKFDSEEVGEITVSLDKIKELKSSRPFAIVPKEVSGSKKGERVLHGIIYVTSAGINVVPVPEETTKTIASTSAKEEAKPSEATALPKEPITTSSQAPAPPSSSLAAVKSAPAKSASSVPATNGQEIAASHIGFIVDDATYEKETLRKIHWNSAWDGHITTGSTVIRATQNSYLFLTDIALQRNVPTVSWLDPKLRTTLNYTQSAGKTSQPGTVTTVTNIFHASAEHDEYYSPRGYYLQQVNFDHDTTQGLDLQQIYGGGIGATLFKQENSEFDLTADLHYEEQAFNSTAEVSYLNRKLIGSLLSEAYTRKFGKIQFDEKALADLAWNNENAFSASAKSSVRMPIYKKLGYSVAVIDSFQNDPQEGYRKNSFQLSTGLSLSLH